MTRTCLGVEVTVDRQATVIVAASLAEANRPDIRLLEPVEGTEDAIPALTRQAEGLADALEFVVIDPRSNAATLVDPARRAGLPVKCPDARDLAVAHGAFADLMNAGKLRHHGQPRLTAAIRYATARNLAGARAIQRYGNQVDPAPAVAAELAVWGLGDVSEAEHEPGAWIL